jgi:hypothetical protein
MHFAVCLAGLGLGSASAADEPTAPTSLETEFAHLETPLAKASFETFVTSWLSQLAEDAQEERERNHLSVHVSDFNLGHSYRDIATEYEIRFKETGRASAPYVGVVRYVEHRYDCIGAPTETCQRVDSSEIYEIFPFKNGNWHY